MPVAKHGNRAFTSKSGAADVLSALGIGLDLPIEKLEQALVEAGICFLMAPRHHGAMRNVAGPRVELAPSRTIFNLLGPMSNPATVKRQLVGVFDRRWLKPVAEALGQLGLERALVVHGQDGMDELTTTTKSWAASLEDGKVREIEIAPEDVGVKRASMAELKGGDAAHNAAAIKAVLGGEKNAFRDIVVLNSAGGADGRRQGGRPQAGRRPRHPIDRQRQGGPRARHPAKDLRMSDTLDKIVARKRSHVGGRMAQRPHAHGRGAGARHRFAARLRQGAQGHHRRGPLRPDRRDQEGLAQQGPDPRPTSTRLPSPAPTNAAARPACRC